MGRQHDHSTAWRRPHERGQSAVEFALIVPFFLVMVFLVVEMTSALKTWMVLENASREGARYSVLRDASGCHTTAQVQNVTINKSNGIPVTAANVTVSPCDTPGKDRQVEIRYTYAFRTPLARLLGLVSAGTIDTTMDMYTHTHMRME